MTILKYNISLKCSGIAIAFFISLMQPSSVFAQINTAQLTIEAVTNSSAKRGKNFQVTQYSDESCSKRGRSEKLDEKKYVDKTHTFKPLQVNLDTPFLFQVSYVEKRRKNIRRCSAMANPDLQPGHEYKAVFTIVDEVVGCNIKMYDLGASSEGSADSVPVEMVLEKPANTCDKVGKKGYSNGTAVYTNASRLD